MKIIGIIGAMEEEVEILKSHMENVTKKVKASMEFFYGFIQEKEVIVVRSGIGKVNMAVCTQILIDDFQVSALINTGVAGSLRNEINIGDIVLSKDTMQHDVDATGFGYKKGEIPRMETSIFKGDEELINLAKQCCEKVNQDIQCFVGRVVTGDQFISDGEKKQELIKSFDGYCTEMEGAAMGQVAYLNQVPFVVIRAISDKADHSAEMNYQEFEEQAILHTTHLMLEMIKMYE